MERLRDVLGDPFLKEAFTPSQKREIRERQEHHCAMCGSRNRDKTLEVHHKVPMSKGGTDATENGVALCEQDHAIANRMFIQFGISYNQLIDVLRPIVKPQPQHDIMTSEYEGMVNRDAEHGGEG